jgi:2-haloacid dehalogenase
VAAAAAWKFRFSAGLGIFCCLPEPPKAMLIGAAKTSFYALTDAAIGRFRRQRRDVVVVIHPSARERTMSTFKPKYITFDCYGTLINYRPGDMARELFADRVPAASMEQFLKNFSAYRLDEVLGAWKPLSEVLANALRRTCRRWGVEYRPEEARRIYEAVPSWGPHPDVPEPLARIAPHIPLVILSNAMNDQIHSNVAKLGAPFHAVFTAQQAQASKPRLQAFEYMFDQLGCSPAQPGRRAARLVQPALRPDVGGRHRHP